MKYAIIENETVANLAIATPEYAAAQGWIEANDSVEIGWGYVNGQFVPPPRDVADEWRTVRLTRDDLLTQSDINVLPDRWAAMTPEQQQAWSVYRQALRDIPATFNDPADVVWPTKPGA